MFLKPKLKLYLDTKHLLVEIFQSEYGKFLCQKKIYKLLFSNVICIKYSCY